METNSAAEKLRSFSRNGFGNKSNENVETSKYGDNCSKEFEDEGEDNKDMTAAGLSLPEVVYEVDQFLERSDHESRVEVPESVLLLPKLVGSMVEKYDGTRYKFKFGRDPEEDTRFLEAVDRISKVSNKLSNTKTQTWSRVLDKNISAQEKAMYLLEKELCNLLEDPKANPSDCPASRTPTKSAKKSSSFNSLFDSDLSAIPEHESSPASTCTPDEEEFPGFSPETVSNMNKIATAMIDAGYEIECHVTFSNFRRTAFKSLLHDLGYVTVSMEDIQKMNWESLEGQIGTWNNVVRHCTTTLFAGERKLYESVFPKNPSVSKSLFSDLARAVIVNFLNFAEAVTLTSRSVEKLFKFLDMYETLEELEPLIDGSYPRGCAQELEYEIATAKGRLGEGVASMFSDLENSIKSDNERIPVPNGAVHPLTRYVMNYLKYACEYRDTLEKVFQQLLVKGTHNSNNQTSSLSSNSNSNQGKMEDGTPKNSPLSVQLMTVMDLLNANLEMKSTLYRDPALRFIFLMNNGRYIVQKVKGSEEIHESMGDNWCRKKQSDLKMYHKNYRETWNKLLHCLSQESMQGSGKVTKSVVKDRFKTFNNMFEEIHKVQSTWMVSDKQLQSELRVSISTVMIPAYRSFVARFKQHLASSKQMDKCIKYQPEDIESMIDDLYDGYASSMARRRN
ncbi:hypothetical protein L6164_010774 [Bauhinia variegata]|uniref:Uncharacterized protein n=1 Tax=Bauhinia variegata TaxID=167791 RepID=A0ACB9P7M0_BAUVA|nr:hypothetical protein L6164_010774 [Bauhinia variegata]